MLSHAQDKTAVANNQPNIISVMPLQFTENGLGFGGSYERAIDKKGIIAFYIPAMVTFDVANSNRIYNYNTGMYSTGKADAMFYTMPGIKYYPTGCYGKIKYAVGPSLVVGAGQKSSNLTDLHGLNVTENVQSHFLAGGMLQNSVNIKTGKNLYLCVELGMGGSFINDVGKVKQDNEFLIQGSFKIGYRF
jgi:hypothetical protein